MSNGFVSSDAECPLRFQGHAVIFWPMNALDVLCAQLTRDLFAIAKFLLICCRILLILYSYAGV